MDYLAKFKEKCNLTDGFMQRIDFLFEKLLSFGYIDNISVSKLTKKLYQNIDTVFLIPDKTHDYKTGYYDAIKKELYIKDLNDLESFFLRIIYALTTTKKKDNEFQVGYSTTLLSRKNYKQEHVYFGFNRAVVSNLVCRLLYTEPTTLSIVPTYRTYKNDFLGNRIDADNNMYFLEGQILKQLCYSLDMQEEDLYYHLFVKPGKFLDRILTKGKVENPERLLTLLDRVSKDYSNYNKLLYYNVALDNNYLSSKKRLPDEKQDEKLVKERDTLKYEVCKALEELFPGTEEEDLDDVEFSLNEGMNALEEELLDLVGQIQDILVDTLLVSESRYSPIMFTVKQKELSRLLIYKNEKLEQSIFDTISYKVLNTFESSSSNLIEKMKYSIASEVLSSEKYIKVYSNMQFNRLLNVDLSENEEIMALSVDGTFLQLIKVKDLNKSFKELIDNTEMVKIDNMRFLLNSPISRQATYDIEKIYTYIRNNHEKYKTIEIEKLYITNIYNTSLVIVITDDSFEIFKMDIINDTVTCEKVALSEYYEVFDASKTSLTNKKYKTQEVESSKLFGIL